MGLWKSLLGGGRPSKDDLIRSLAKQRVRQDPLAATMGYHEGMVDALTAAQLAGLPESGIATNVETYALLKKQGVVDDEIFARIEAHRSALGSGEPPDPLTLDSYIRYRLKIEHSAGAPVSESCVAEAIHACRQHFGC